MPHTKFPPRHVSSNPSDDVTSRTMHAQTEIWRSHVQQQQDQLVELELELAREPTSGNRNTTGTRKGAETGSRSETGT